MIVSTVATPAAEGTGSVGAADGTGATLVSAGGDGTSDRHPVTPIRRTATQIVRPQQLAMVIQRNEECLRIFSGYCLKSGHFCSEKTIGGHPKFLQP